MPSMSELIVRTFGTARHRHARAGVVFEPAGVAVADSGRRGGVAGSDAGGAGGSGAARRPPPSQG